MEAKQYGDPCKSSINGCNFVFRKTKAQFKESKIKLKYFEEFWKINVLAISLFGVRFIKSINIRERYDSLKMECKLKSKQTEWFDNFISKTEGWDNT